MAKAEHVYIRVLINSTSSQAKDALSSSTATGWLLCIFLDLPMPHKLLKYSFWGRTTLFDQQDGYAVVDCQQEVKLNLSLRS